MSSKKFKTYRADNFAPKAFSLIELSIVILVISILITGALSISIGNIFNAKSKVTRDRIDQVYQSIGRYVLTNSTLPCPAPVTLIKGSSGYGSHVGGLGDCSGAGIFSSSLSPNLVFGMVPTKDLGLSDDIAEDGFGNKILYVVDKRFTGVGDASPMGTNGFTTLNGSLATDIITIKEITSSGEKIVTSDAVFALVSTGQNGNGAYGMNSTASQQAPTDAFELENYFSPVPANNNNILVSSSNSDIFDDTVFYKTKAELILDFDASSTLTCKSETIEEADFSSNVQFTSTLPTQLSVSNIGEQFKNIPSECMGSAAPSWVGSYNTCRVEGTNFISQHLCITFVKKFVNSTNWDPVKAGKSTSTDCIVRVAKKEANNGGAIPTASSPSSSHVCANGGSALPGANSASCPNASDVGPFEYLFTYTVSRSCDKNGVWENAIRLK